MVVSLYVPARPTLFLVSVLLNFFFPPNSSSINGGSGQLHRHGAATRGTSPPGPFRGGGPN